MAEELDPEVDGYVIAWENEQHRLRETPGTVEWAQTVELPSFLHPIKRVGALRAHAAQLALGLDIPEGLLKVWTRGELVEFVQGVGLIQDIRAARNDVASIRSDVRDMREDLRGTSEG